MASLTRVETSHSPVSFGGCHPDLHSHTTRRCMAGSPKRSLHPRKKTNHGCHQCSSNSNSSSRRSQHIAAKQLRLPRSSYLLTSGLNASSGGRASLLSAQISWCPNRSLSAAAARKKLVMAPSVQQAGTWPADAGGPGGQLYFSLKVCASKPLALVLQTHGGGTRGGGVRALCRQVQAKVLPHTATHSYLGRPSAAAPVVAGRRPAAGHQNTTRCRQISCRHVWHATQDTGGIQTTAASALAHCHQC